MLRIKTCSNFINNISVYRDYTLVLYILVLSVSDKSAWIFRLYPIKNFTCPFEIFLTAYRNCGFILVDSSRIRNLFLFKKICKLSDIFSGAVDIFLILNIAVRGISYDIIHILCLLSSFWGISMEDRQYRHQ